MLPLVFLSNSILKLMIQPSSVLLVPRLPMLDLCKNCLSPWHCNSSFSSSYFPSIPTFPWTTQYLWRSLLYQNWILRDWSGGRERMSGGEIRDDTTMSAINKPLVLIPLASWLWDKWWCRGRTKSEISILGWNYCLVTVFYPGQLPGYLVCLSLGYHTILSHWTH